MPYLQRKTYLHSLPNTHSKSEVFNIHNFFINLTDILHSFHDSSFSSKISFNDLLISFPHSFIDLTPSTPVKHVITMGQQLSSSIDINEPRASLEFPRWYFLRIFLFIILQVHTWQRCQYQCDWNAPGLCGCSHKRQQWSVSTNQTVFFSSFHFSTTNLRILCYRFYPNYTPLLFIKKQFQTRLAILHPDFLKVSLKSTKTNTIVPFIHSTNCAWRSKYGKSSCYDWFRCILTTFVLLTSIELLQSPDYWCSCLFVHIKKQNNILFKWSFLIFTIQSLIHRLYYITDFLTQLATEYHNKYKINVFLFAEICSTLVDILSDCLRFFFFLSFSIF